MQSGSNLNFFLGHGCTDGDSDIATVFLVQIGRNRNGTGGSRGAASSRGRIAGSSAFNAVASRHCSRSRLLEFVVSRINSSGLRKFLLEVGLAQQPFAGSGKVLDGKVPVASRTSRTALVVVLAS